MAGFKQLRRWTPKLAHRFASARVEKIRDLLVEIAGTYDDVDQLVIAECDRLIEHMLELTEALDGSLAEGFSR